MTEGPSLPIGEIELHLVQTENQNIPKIRPANDQTGTESQNTLIIPQFLTCGVHTGLIRLQSHSTPANALIYFL
jgi:hypothetical protein